MVALGRRRALRGIRMRAGHAGRGVLPRDPLDRCARVDGGVVELGDVLSSRSRPDPPGDRGGRPAARARGSRPSAVPVDAGGLGRAAPACRGAPRRRAERELGDSDARFSLPYFWNNLRTNTAFYPGDHRFPGARHAAGAGRPERVPRHDGAGGLVRRVLGGVSLLLRGQLQLRRRRAVLAHESCAAGRARGASARPGSFAGSAPERSRAGARCRSRSPHWRFSSPGICPGSRAVGEEAWGARADVRVRP